MILKMYSLKNTKTLLNDFKKEDNITKIIHNF